MHQVPTVAELAERKDGSAEVTAWVNDGTAKNPKMRPSQWRLLDKGYAILGELMRANALEAIARGDGEWVEPPSSIRIPAKIVPEIPPPTEPAAPAATPSPLARFRPRTGHPS